MWSHAALCIIIFARYSSQLYSLQHTVSLQKPSFVAWIVCMLKSSRINCTSCDQMQQGLEHEHLTSAWQNLFFAHGKATVLVHILVPCSDFATLSPVFPMESSASTSVPCCALITAYTTTMDSCRNACGTLTSHPHLWCLGCG